VPLLHLYRLLHHSRPLLLRPIPGKVRRVSVMARTVKQLGYVESWLASLMVRGLNLRLNCREFDPRPPHYRSVAVVVRAYHLGM